MSNFYSPQSKSLDRKKINLSKELKTSKKSKHFTPSKLLSQSFTGSTIIGTNSSPKRSKSAEKGYSIEFNHKIQNTNYSKVSEMPFNQEEYDHYDDHLSIETTDELDSNQQIIEMKSQRIAYLESELKKTSSYLIDIQTKLHQTQLLLEATEVANREGQDNRVISEMDKKIKEILEENRIFNQELNDLKIEKQEFELNTKQLLLQIHERDENIKRLSKETSLYLDEKNKYESQLNELRNSLDAKTEEIREFREKISELESEKLQLRERYVLKTNAFIEDVSESMSAQQELQSESVLNLNLESNIVNNKNLQIQYITLKKAYEDLLKNYQTIQEDTINKSLRQSSETKESLEGSLQHHIEMISNLQNRLQEREDRITQLEEDVSSLKSKLELQSKLSVHEQREKVESFIESGNDISLVHKLAYENAPETNHQQVKQLQRTISSLRSMISNFIHNESNYKETIEKLRNQVQQFHNQSIFYSNHNRQIMLGESALLNRIESLTQKCIILEGETSQFRLQNENLLLKNSELKSIVRDLTYQIQEQKRDCTILSRQLNHNVEEYFEKHKEEILKLFGGKQSSKIVKPQYKQDENLCVQLDRILNTKSKTIPKDEATQSYIRGAIQTIRRLIQSSLQQNESLQKMQADSKIMTQLQARYYKLLNKIEIERDIILQKHELMQKEIDEINQSKEEQISSSIELYQTRIKHLYQSLSNSNQHISDLYLQFVESRRAASEYKQQLEEKSKEMSKMQIEFEKKLREQQDDAMKANVAIEESIQKYYDNVIIPILRDDNSHSSSELSQLEKLVSELHGQKQLEKTILLEQRILSERLHNAEEQRLKLLQSIDILNNELITVRKNSIHSSFEANPSEEQLQRLQIRYDDLLNLISNSSDGNTLKQTYNDILSKESNTYQTKQVNQQFNEENQKLKKKLAELKTKLNNYEEKKIEENHEYEQQIIAFEGQNNILISKLATHKLKIDELSSQLKEKEAEIEQLHSVITKKFGSKKKEATNDVTEQLKALIKSSSATHAKLRQALQNEIDLRDKLEKKTNQITELKKALESVQKFSGTLSGKKSRASSVSSSPMKSSSRSIVRLSGTLTEREGEINVLRRTISTLELDIVRLREDLEKEKNLHSTSQIEYEKQIASLNEKLQASVKQKRDLERRIETVADQTKSQEATLETERERLILKLQEITTEHEKLHEQFTSQNFDYVECKILLGKRESEIVEKESQIHVLKEHLKHLQESLEAYKEELKSKTFEYEKSQVINDGNLDKTLTHLQQEQSNVQKLMDLVHKLQQENDLLIKEKMNSQKLKDQLQALQPKYDQLVREKFVIEEQFTAAKDYILQLRQERDQIKQNLKQEKEKFSSELKNFNLIQKHQESSLKNRIEEMEAALEECQNEFKEKEKALQESFHVYVTELKNNMETEKQEIMKECVLFQKSEHRYKKSISELEESLKTETEKRKDTETKLIQEKENNMEQISQIDQDFRNYKDAQEKVVDVYEKELKSLRENSKNSQALESQLNELMTQLEDKNQSILELERLNKDYEEQVSDLKSKTKSLNKQISKLQKEYNQEKETLQEHMEEAKKNNEEVQSATEELKTAKKQIKQLNEEHAKKTKIIASMKEERDELQEKILKYESEHQQLNEKIKSLTKDMSRKEKLVMEYKLKLETKKQDFATKEDQNNSMKTKIKEFTISEARKDKLIKDLQNVIEQKNKYTTQLKNQIKQIEDESEKKENKMKTLETKIERIQQTDDLKNKHLTEQTETLKSILLSLAEDQVKAIEKLEIKLNATVASSNQINSILKKQIGNTSLESISRISEEQRYIADTSSISIHMLNLSPEELQDIMSSTKLIEESHIQRQEAILQRNDKSESAKSQLLILKNCLSNNDIPKARKALDKILSIRLELEKSLSIANKDNFFSQPLQSIEEASERPRNSEQGSNEEAQFLKDELKKMHEREQIYESTIQSLEHHLNQLLSPES